MGDEEQARHDERGHKTAERGAKHRGKVLDCKGSV
jgi:hypothetical protein